MASHGQCPECKEETELVEDRAQGDVICKQCGLVLEERAIDESSEWRTFTNDANAADPVRVGGPSNPLLTDGGLSTVITKTGQGSAEGANLSRWQNRGANPDRNLINAFRQIGGMAERLNLVATIKDRANEIYKQIEDLKSLRGRGMEAILAACLYIACRQESKPRTFKEICAVTKDASKKEIGRCYKFIVAQLEHNMGEFQGFSRDYLRRFCSRLGLSHEVVRACEEVVDRANALVYVHHSKSPPSVAAAVIFLVAQLSDNKKTQKEIALVAGVSDVTLKHAYKDLLAKATELVPSWFAPESAVLQLPSP
eukprot:jgi/Mesvir1/6533/Mv16795-RA.1